MNSFDVFVIKGFTVREHFFILFTWDFTIHHLKYPGIHIWIVIMFWSLFKCEIIGINNRYVDSSLPQHFKS